MSCYFIDCDGLFVVKNDAMRAWRIFFFHLLNFNNVAINLKKTLLYQQSYIMFLNSKLLQLLRHKISRKWFRNDNVVCNHLVSLVNEERKNLKILIFELQVFFIVKLICIILLLFNYLLVDKMTHILKDLSKILLFWELQEMRSIHHSFSKFSLPATVRKRNCFEPHFVPQLLHILEQLLVCVKFCSANSSLRC